MRIILADHHTQALWALKKMLQEEPAFTLVGEAETAQDLLALIETQAADLVLLDRELPGASIEDLIASLHAREPRPIVIVMSSQFEHSRMVLRAGADVFVSKGDPPDWLLENLHKYARRTQ